MVPGRDFDEWHRIIDHGGYLEIWVPNGLEICKSICLLNWRNAARSALDNCFKFNDEKTHFYGVTEEFFIRRRDRQSF
jgi:hypothetical protein